MCIAFDVTGVKTINISAAITPNLIFCFILLSPLSLSNN
ncbi:putative membrane protein [Clostridioides difficile P31]|nr:putative membrane protein [Clostridioides difficile DA00145]EQJ44276.1 putative membrane protein [Clostridioides difficile P23]EQJ84605.1 putative membrane protein [Clostridioides difficile P45]EQK91433.1 putative membrane protein [Clostridioides difficile P31]